MSPPRDYDTRFGGRVAPIPDHHYVAIPGPSDPTCLGPGGCSIALPKCGVPRILGCQYRSRPPEISPSVLVGATGAPSTWPATWPRVQARFGRSMGEPSRRQSSGPPPTTRARQTPPSDLYGVARYPRGRPRGCTHVPRGPVGAGLVPFARAAALSVSVATQVHAWTWSPDLVIAAHTDADESGQDRRLGYPRWMPDAADEKATSTASNRLINRHFRLV